jgi:RNA polymerase sigma-70 factor, ECF subfamily
LSETTRLELRAADLVPRAQAGQADAREALLASCHATVRRWAGVLTDDPDDADDVAQEALIQVSRRLGSYAGRARFTTWLYQVTRNTALSLRRRVTRRLRLLGGMAAMQESPAPDPSVRAEASELRHVVAEVFRELPVRQREIFYLVDVEGHEAVAVASRLGLRPATVRAHLFRARHALRSRILERHPEIAEEFRP